MIEKLNVDVGMQAGLIANVGLVEKLAAPKFRYRIDCVGADGKLKWSEEVDNLITTEGGNYLLDTFFKLGTLPSGWYLGLAGTGTKAITDTLASHAAWSEVNPYTGNRKTITFGTTSAKSNTATLVAFAITGSATVAGAFIANANTGTSGVLYSVSDFASSRAVVSGDTLNVTPTVSC